MPNELKIYSCKFCGFESASRNECVNCENSHLHAPDLAVGRVEKPSDSESCYDPQSIWPTFLYIKSVTKAIDGCVYRLVKTSKANRRVPR